MIEFDVGLESAIMGVNSSKELVEANMTPMTGIVRNGKLEIDLPLPLAEGTAVQVWVNAIDDDGPMSPEEIARTLKAMDEMIPLEMSEAEIEEWRKTRKLEGQASRILFDENTKRIAERFDEEASSRYWNP